MSKKNEVTIAGKSFEELKQVNEHGAEFWSARALQPMLGYSQWRRFEQAIGRAVTSCKESGNPPENHFAGAGKMVELGSGSAREVDDFQLSRFACYLIAQNGDPRKPEIARAQQYFAVHTRRQGSMSARRADYWARRKTKSSLLPLPIGGQQAFPKVFPQTTVAN
jgi:DNA-damage-inducible protein D